ncbi:testis-expressed protein 11-like [Centruroides vittatus]|uniref:testis-expressed protein 11-like n=1 Tax=Centruroides vittatus TaxID=120091 RepID=UPI0035102B33
MQSNKEDISLIQAEDCIDELMNELDNVLCLLENSIDDTCENIDAQIMETSLHSLRDISICLLKNVNLDGDKFTERIKNYLHKLNKLVHNKLNARNFDQSNALLYEIFSRFLLLNLNINNDFNLSFKIKNLIIVIKLLLKACRVWMINKNPLDAKQTLDFLQLCLSMFQEIIKNGNLSNNYRIDLEKYKTINTLYRLELSVNAGENEKGSNYFSEIKEIVYDFPLLQSYLTDLCYNNGVKCFEEENYKWSVFWLRESYGLRRKGEVQSSQSAQTLKLLANAYIKWDAERYWQEALHAIELVDTRDKQLECFLDRLYIILHSGKPLYIEEFVNKLLDSPNFNCNSIQFAEMLLKFGYVQLALKFISNFKDIPQSEIKRFLTLKLNLYFEQRNFKEAKNVIKQYLNELKSLSDPESDQNVFLFAMEIGTEYLKKKLYEDAVQCYQCCLLIYEELTNNNNHHNVKDHINWLKRQLSFSYIEVGLVDKSKELLDDTEFIKNGDLLSLLLVLKIGILSKDKKLIEETVNIIVLKINNQKTCIDDAVSTALVHLLMKYYRLALENNDVEFNIQIFDKLYDNILGNYPTKLKLLQCSIQLQISHGEENLDFNRILSDVEKSEECLQAIQDDQEIEDKCVWFSKICWNVAIQENVPQFYVYRLFRMGWKIMNIIKEVNVDVITRRNNFLLLAVASGLYMFRSENETNMNSLSEMIFMIDQYKKSNNLTGNVEHDNTFIQILLLYEFEIRIKLKSPTLQNCFECMSNMTQLDAKFFELISSLSMEHNLLYYRITINALKIAITKNLKNERIDVMQLSRNYHSLIHVMLKLLNSGKTDIYEETLSCLTELLRIIKTKLNKQYPEIELVWVMVECWNCGIYFLMRNNTENAYEWCNLSLKFLQYLNALKSVHGDKMRKMFKELFCSNLK